MKSGGAKQAISVLLFCICLSASADLALSVRGGRSLPLVIAENPAPSLGFAAKEWNRHLLKLTGGQAEILHAEPSDGRCIELVLAPLVCGDEDSFSLHADDRKLTVRGGTRGVLYGVFEILETYGGVGWYSRTYTHIPRLERLTVPAPLDRVERPAFDVRWPGWSAQRDMDGLLALHLRLNGTGVAGRRPAYGGVRYRFGKGWTSHTYNRLCPVEKYGNRHPEYFSEIRGRRRLAQTQLCTTNPDVREIACSNLFAAIRGDPSADVWQIEQNDYYFHCECPKCAAIDAREETHAGAALEFANFLAGRVAREFPGKTLQFSAYQFTRKPPKFLRPADNMVVELAAIECDYSRPFGSADDAPMNREFMEDLEGWCRIAPRINLYDYTTNYRRYMHPFPNLDAIAGNIRYYRDHGVKILYSEGSGAAHADLAELKPWLVSKLAWNPDMDLEELVGAFCRGHYGKAAPNVLDYIRASRACVKPGTLMSVFDDCRPSLYTDSFLDGQLANFREAEKAVADDPDRLYNVRMTAASAYVAKLDYLVDRTKFWWATERPEAFDGPTGAADLFAWMQLRDAEAREKGEPIVLCANRGKDALARRDWARLAAWKRPQKGGRSCFVPALEMTHATPNNGFRGGWFVREVEDADAVGGKAAAVNCDFPKCVLSFRLRNVALDAGEMYSARIRVRGEAAPGAAGEAFAVLASGGRELLSVSAADLSQKWKWHDLGEFAASEDGGFNVYVSRLEKGGEAAVRSLFVDGVEISKTGGGPRCRKAKAVRVADFGYSADDASACVRRAMASDADELVFDAAHSPWIVEPLRFVDVSNKSIRFERGVEVRAKPGAFLARNACLMAFIGGSDVSLVGPGAVFRMERDVYTNAPYAKSEHRHCLTLRGVRNFRVEGLSFVESGGDGILLGGRFVGKRFQTAENVRLDHVVCDRNFRQGLSVISASNLVATCCVFSNTRGTPPQSGVDLEPNQPYEMLSEIVFRDCRFENNAGCGLEFYVGHLNSGSMPVTTLLEGCSLVGNVYGFEYQQNRKTFDDLPAGGAVTLRRCRISGARSSGILVVDKPGTSAKLTFDDVVVSDCCRLAKSSDVTVYNRLPDTAPADGFLFRNFAVERGKGRPWLSSACTNATGRVAVDVVGSVTVKTGDRSETVKPMSVWGGNGDSKAKGRYR